MFLLVINISRLIANIAWFTLAVIVFVILYRLLLKRLRKKRPSTEHFIVLHPVEPDPVKGEIQLFFESKVQLPISFTIYPIDESSRTRIAEAEYKKGGHVVMLDSTRFKNGLYFLEVTTPHQKISRRFEIKNV